MSEINEILPDIPRIYTALAEWLACLICIMELKKRFTKVKTGAICAAALVGQSIFLIITGNMDGIWWILCMVGAIVLMLLFLYICCETTFKDAGYYCVRAFVVAEFAASLQWQIDCFIQTARGATNWIWGSLLTLFVVYGVVYTIIWKLYQLDADKETTIQVTNRELISTIIIGLAVFLMSNVGFASINTPFTVQNSREIFIVRTLIDLGGVVILYAFHIQRMDLRMRHELESVESILHNQYIQYKQSQEAMDIINYKYHDLKHYMIAIRAENNPEKRNEYLDRIEEELENYEAQSKTGNRVLDTLLTSKNIYCKKNSIAMTCVVDGALFDFMDTMDICSIFGNALDNAIECEKKISVKEKRLIHVSAFSQKQFLIIRFENYCEDNLSFEGILPITTKNDASVHGYGLKSVQYTVRKYGGEVNISVKDSWFILKILIPIV